MTDKTVSRRAMLLRMGLLVGAVYAAPSVTTLGAARASGASGGGSGASGGGSAPSGRGGSAPSGRGRGRDWSGRRGASGASSPSR
jgi:hypothetical protein